MTLFDVALLTIDEILEDRYDHKNKQNRTLIEAFGGAKSSSTIETLVENWKELFTKQRLIREGLKKMPGELRFTEKQPATELATAWRSIEVSLIKIGNELLPVAVPAVKKIAEYGGKAADVFRRIPGSVAGIGAAALVAIGPLSSMLGYLAGGTGGFLNVANGLAKAGIRFNTTLSPNVMTEKHGFKGALSAAFGGTGAAGAMRAAKGFATAIGPAVAAAGIGSIVLSATHDEWEKVGFEGGGAMIGGLAAMLTGNPELAPLTAGLGTFAGKFLSGLFSSAPKIPIWQQRLASSVKEVKAAFGGEQSASERLAASGKTLVKAHHRQREAATGLRRAEHALERIRANAPAGSHRIVEAEVEVAEAIEGVRRARHRTRRDERLHGEDRAIAMEGFQLATLAGRNRKRVLGHRLTELRGERRAIGAHFTGHERLLKLQSVNGRIIEKNEKLLGVSKELNGVWADAAKQIGPGYAELLRHGGRKAVIYGSKLKAAKANVVGIKDSIEELTRAIGGASSAFEKGDLESRANALRQGLPGAEHRVEHLEGARHRGHGTSGHKHVARARHLSFAKSRPLKLNPAALLSAPQGAGRDIHVTVQSVLDGQVIAEHTAKTARKAALLQ